MTKGRLAAACAAAGLIMLTAGCGEKAAEPFHDADRSSRTNDSPADVIEMPDGFSNVATKCDSGNRIYVLFKGDSAYGSIAVVPNAEGCQE
jgi:hypothetical protein